MGIISNKFTKIIPEPLYHIGDVKFIPYDTPPQGWFECDGRSLLISSFPELFAKLGTRFGGDGVNTFNLPDLRGVFIRGWDHGKGIDPGRVFGTEELDAFQGHRHDLRRKGASASGTAQAAGAYNAAVDPGSTNDTAYLVYDPIADTVNGTPRTASETRPRNVALMPIIKAKNIAGSDEVVAGANADTLDGLHASDFVLASEWNCNFKNKLMNGNLDIWQRTQPSTLTNALSYVADRFMSYPGAGGTATIARKTFDLGQTIVPDNPSYYYEHTQAATSTDPPWMLQWVEGVIHSSGKTMTLSFWAKADKAITANIEFRQTWDSSMGVNGWTNSSLTPVSLTTSWQKYQVTYTYPSLSGKTLGINNYYGFVIFLPASTTFTFDLANVQLEEGSIATSFEHRPIGLEVMMCQRYFERPVGRILGTMPTGYSGYLTWQYKVLKRTIPTVGKGSSSYTAVQTVDQGTLSVYQTSGSVITIEDNAYVDAELY